VSTYVFAHMSQPFVHLHCHTEFSTLDSMARIKMLAAKAAEYGMPAVAMTDHGNLFAAVPFYQKMHAAGVKPILGCEVFLAPGLHTIKKDVPGRKRSTHLTLLAKNTTGWKNLTKLVSVSHLDGDYFGEPRVDYELLEKFSEGLICMSGDSEGPIHEWLEKNDKEEANNVVKRLKAIYGEDDFYIELMDHELEKQREFNLELIEMAKANGVKLVATNDVHFIGREDHEAHDVLICIGEKRLLLDENRKRYPEEVYFKTADEMAAVFKDIPEAISNTIEIADKCNVELVLDPTSSEKYPQFDSPDGSPRDEYFRKVCYDGLKMRYGEEELARLDSMWGTDREATWKTLTERLDYEIDIIVSLGFASYFLITADFIVWGLNQNIPVGPGRGSAAGSLVAYVMKITDICPMRFGLLFERFLNPERVSPPDVDIDFCQTRRPEVIEYVRQKYGERCVSHIITYGTLGAKSVLRDVARTMGVSFGDADKLAKLIEAKPGVKLMEEFEAKEELRDLVASSTTFTELWDYAVKLEGLNRNTGVHAAGVVIGDGDLDEHVPLARAKEGEVVTQADMGAITDIGLLKMDFLGLKNLTVIQDGVNHIRKHTPDFDINKVPLDDKPALALLNRGETMGVFQLESGGMVETCKKYGINKIEDIIDLLAVYRPGAMQYIDEMIAVKKGERTVDYEHPLLETICGDTYGVMIYQEQVQNAAKVLAGYTLGGADVLRRAMGKKKPEEMAKQRKIFVAGAKETNNIDANNANKIFDKIAGFAGYGFNKSHSACYGHISYWTAYLKANYPVEFMSGLLSNEINNTEKISVFVAECHRMEIEILPPDLNKSWQRFTPERTPSGKLAIRFGLAAIKNVGEGAMEAAIKEREANGPFESMDDVSKRLDSKDVNKKIFENLIKAGAMDWTGESRAGMFDRVADVIAAAATAHKDKAQGQGGLFDTMDFSGGGETTILEVVEVEEWPKDQRLEDEKTLLGFYVTGHPLDKFRGVVDKESYQRLGLIDDIDISQKKRFRFAGMIRHVEHKTTQAGKPFGVIYLEDFTGSAEIVCWSESYTPARDEGLLEPGSVIAMYASIRIDDRSEMRRLTGSQMKELKPRKVAASSTKAFDITLRTTLHTKADLEEIAKIIKQHPGRVPVAVHIQDSLGKRATIECSDKFKVRRSAALDKSLSRWME